MMTTQASNYEFLQTLKSKSNSKNDEKENLGILIAYNSMMHYLGSYNKDKSVAYYCCSKMKITGCKATAIVHKIEDRYVVHKCASLDDHNHDGDMAAILSEKILLKMAEKVQWDPTKKLKKIHDEVLDSYEADYGNKDIWEKVISALGTEEARLKRMRRIRTKTKGEIIKPKASIKQKPLESKHSGGSSLTFPDTNEDLSKDWKQPGSTSPSNSIGECNDIIENGDDTDDEDTYFQSEVPKKEMLRLHCNSFEMNIYNAWQNFQTDDDLSDVTIACDDDPSHQIQAHKIILSSFSPVFSNLLRLNPGQKPLVFLRGVKYNELVDIMNYIYKGEVNIIAEEVNNFIALAQDLKIKGLSEEMVRNGQLQNSNFGIKNPFENETTSPEKKKAKHSYLNPEKNDNPFTKKANDCSALKMDMSKCDTYNVQTFSSERTTVFHEDKELASNDDEIDRLPWKETILDQFDENNDVTSNEKQDTFSYTCDYCDFKTSQKFNFQQHLDSMHEGVRYFCDQCTFKTPKRYKLAQHIDSIHECVRFKCDCCEYIATKKGNLKKHITKMHSQFR